MKTAYVLYVTIPGKDDFTLSVSSEEKLLGALSNVLKADGATAAVKRVTFFEEEKVP